jgi:membrane protease YdiL (CAAX protease family)
MDVTPVPAPKPNPALRILRFPVTLIVVEFIALGVLGLPLESINLVPVRGVSPPELFAIVVAAVIVFILIWKAFRRWVEGERDREFAFSGAGREVGAGLLAGFVLFSAMTGLVALLGGIEVTGVRSFGGTQFWIWAGVGITSGIVEETLFRGVLLRQLEKLVGTWWALALTSILFGAVHLSNRDATWTGAIGIMLEAGILLGAAYLYTRRLWFAAGLHAAWNFTQGWVFSIPVSGTGQPIGILVTERHGPEWLTGGKFGLEASLAAVFVATVAGLVLLWKAYRKGGFVAPIWARRSDEAVRIDVDADPHALGER